MLAEIVHRVVAHPRVYDAVQTVVGAHELDRRVGRALAAGAPDQPLILDVGGGTGLSAELWPAGATYVCLDSDPVKLAGFRQKRPAGLAVRGDGTRLPVRTGSIDVVVCKNVSHHLGDRELSSLFQECARVLKPGGRMLFVDAVQAPDRWRSQVLWRYDRGSHPRTIEELRAAMAAQLQITDTELVTIHHRYVISAGTRGS